MIEMILGDSQEIIKTVQNESIDVIFTDPPYLYLKNQKLEKKFDEIGLFSEWKRVLKKNGFIVIFGRGESFYRWNYLLFTLGFSFKEEIIWDKGQCSSPLMSLSRVHETIAIWTKGKGVLNKSKVPYLEMKKHDIGSIIGDIKRLKTTFKNSKHLQDIEKYLETGLSDFNKVMTNKFAATKSSKTMDINRVVTAMKFIEEGMNEKSIIKETRPHYTAIHPTEKPIQLIQRLLKLVTKKGDLVLDCFGGSFSTGEACFELGLDCKIIELDKEYFDNGKQRIENLQRNKPQLKLGF